MRIFLAFIFAILAVPCAVAQENSIDSLASQMAKAISKSKQKSVVVFDFVGPDKRMTELGQRLADDFSSAIAGSSAKLTVGDRSQIHDALERDYLAPSAVQDTDAAWCLAQEVRTQAFITGKLSIRENSLVVELHSLSVHDGKLIKDFEFAVPLTQEMNTLLGKAVAAKREAPLATPPSGTGGYSYPSCRYCPNAQFTHEATVAKMQGSVILQAVIGADGRAHDIQVIKSLPCGLARSAVESVQNWLFTPATGPDGNPAAVRQTIEVTFHMY